MQYFTILKSEVLLERGIKERKKEAKDTASQKHREDKTEEG